MLLLSLNCPNANPNLILSFPVGGTYNGPDRLHEGPHASRIG